MTVDGDDLITMPGTLAAAYGAAGGHVVLMGKPAPLIYEVRHNGRGTLYHWCPPSRKPGLPHPIRTLRPRSSGALRRHLRIVSVLLLQVLPYLSYGAVACGLCVQACGELLGLPAAELLAVGDSLEHDIAG